MRATEGWVAVDGDGAPLPRVVSARLADPKVLAGIANASESSPYSAAELVAGAGNGAEHYRAHIVVALGLVVGFGVIGDEQPSDDEWPGTAANGAVLRLWFQRLREARRGPDEQLRAAAETVLRRKLETEPSDTQREALASAVFHKAKQLGVYLSNQRWWTAPAGPPDVEFGAFLRDELGPDYEQAWAEEVAKLGDKIKADERQMTFALHRVIDGDGERETVHLWDEPKHRRWDHWVPSDRCGQVMFLNVLADIMWPSVQHGLDRKHVAAITAGTISLYTEVRERFAGDTDDLYGSLTSGFAVHRSEALDERTVRLATAGMSMFIAEKLLRFLALEAFDQVASRQVTWPIGLHYAGVSQMGKRMKARGYPVTPRERKHIIPILRRWEAVKHATTGDLLVMGIESGRGHLRITLGSLIAPSNTGIQAAHNRALLPVPPMPASFTTGQPQARTEEARSQWDATAALRDYAAREPVVFNMRGAPLHYIGTHDGIGAASIDVRMRHIQHTLARPDGWLMALPDDRIRLRDDGAHELIVEGGERSYAATEGGRRSAAKRRRRAADTARKLSSSRED